MSQVLILALIILVVLGVAAVVAGRAAARGRNPWIALTLAWLAATLPAFVVRSEFTSRSALSALSLLAPLGVTILATHMEVRRGCSLRRAGSVAVLLGLTVAAATPFLTAQMAHLLRAATDFF